MSIGVLQASGKSSDQGGAYGGEYSGDVSTGPTVDGSNLTAINSTGLLTYSLQNVAGSRIDVTGRFVSFDLIAVPTAAVPEPATWAMMILGIGAIGVSMRSGRRATDPAAAAG